VLFCGLVWAGPAAPLWAWDPLQNAERTASEGQRALAAGDSTRAIESMLRAQALAPEDPRIRMALAETFYGNGAFEAARAQFEAAALEEPRRRAQALYNAGNAAFRAQDFRAALDLYTEALLLAPEEERDDVRVNLELAQRMLEQAQPQSQPSEGESTPDSDSQQQQSQQPTPPDESQPPSSEEPPESEEEEPRPEEEPQQEPQAEQEPSETSSPPDSSATPPPEPAAADSAQVPPPEGMTPEEALRLLQALDQDEAQLRESIQRRLRGTETESEHDW
jgi:tetratricopeptide (TPR) repeat protein